METASRKRDRSYGVASVRCGRFKEDVTIFRYLGNDVVDAGKWSSTGSPSDLEL